MRIYNENITFYIFEKSGLCTNQQLYYPIFNKNVLNSILYLMSLSRCWPYFIRDYKINKAIYIHIIIYTKNFTFDFPTGKSFANCNNINAKYCMCRF